MKYIVFIFSIILTVTVCFGNKVRVYDVNSGLSINTTASLLQDHVMGFVWIGTKNGLNRFDGKSFTKYFHDRNTPSLCNNLIHHINEDGRNRLWIATNDGISIYDFLNDTWINTNNKSISGKIFRIEPFGKDTSYLYVNYSLYKVIVHENNLNIKEIMKFDNIISDIEIVEDKLWIATRKRLYLMDLLEKTILTNYDIKYITYLKYTPTIGKMWYKVGQQSLYSVELNSKHIADFSKTVWWHADSKRNPLPNSYVSDIIANQTGDIWISTYTGIAVYNDTAGFIGNMNDEQENAGLPHHSIKSLLIDNSGNLWGGTWHSGIFIVPRNQQEFITYKITKNPLTGIQSKTVRGFSETDNGNLVIANESGGISLYDPEKAIFRYIEPNQKLTPNGNPLRFSNVHSILKTTNNIFWFGYYRNGLQCNDVELDRMIQNAFNRIGKSSFAGTVNCIYQDKNDCLYFVFEKDVYYLEHGNINRFRLDNQNYNDLLVDSKDRIWIGGTEGLYILGKNNSTIAYYNKSNSVEAGLDSRHICVIFEDSNQNIWIGTYGGGLYHFLENNNKFNRVLPPKHFVYQVVFSIEEDDFNNLWMGTNNGLIKYNIENGSYQRYTKEDGIQDNQFNFNASYKGSKGMLYFGGVDGFTFFDPSSIPSAQKLIAPLFINIKTGTSLANKTLNTYAINQLNQENHIKIPFTTKEISFEFFTPDYNNPKKHVYSYKIDGLSDDWRIVPHENNKLTLVNLNPGNYQLHLRVSASNDLWSAITKSCSLTILPPWYKSILAKVGYCLIIILVFIVSVKLVRKREQMQNSLKIAQIKQEQNEAINRSKLQFFTDIAHEIRTPLTLISTPISQLLSEKKIDSGLRSTLVMVNRNANKLSKLMDELLLFRTVEVGKLKLNMGNNNVAEMVNDICELFTEQAKSKNVDFSFDQYYKNSFYNFDREQLEKVLINVISNSFKYTPVNKSISVTTHLNKNFFAIKVRDTGSGIEATELKQIFERFYTANTKYGVGYGIGLSLAKRIVELHKGTINIESKINEGTQVTITIPSQRTSVKVHSEPIKKERQVSINTYHNDNNIIREHHFEVKKGSILIVEDNDEIRNYLTLLMSASYEVNNANNGETALKLAEQYQPDIILTDYQMPVMNGIELCDKIKTSLVTSHIPVIVLSAYHEVEDQLKGFKSGADDYISKPFNVQILMKKIEAIIDNRNRIINSIQSGNIETINKLGWMRVDESFIDKLKNIIDQYISSDDLNVDFLSKELSMARSTLNLKIRKLTGLSVAEYIRKYRLYKALNLLQKQVYSVSEVAYQTGFDPSYFTSCFKKEFGKLPGEFII